MIFTGILLSLMFLANSFLYLIPSVIPATPAGLQDALDNLVYIVSSMIGLINYIYSPMFFALIVFIVVVLFTFNNAYSLFWFVLSKIPIINRLIRRR